MTRIKLTMRAAIACVLMWSLAFSGCSVPDDPNWDAVKSGIAALPPDLAQTARIEHASHQTHRWLNDRYFNTGMEKGPTVVIRLECSDADGQTFVGDFNVDELDNCLYNRATWGATGLTTGKSPLVNSDRQGMLGPGLMGRNTFQECLTFFKRQMVQVFGAHASSGSFTCEPTFFDGLEEASQNPEWDAERVVVDHLATEVVQSSAPPQWFWVGFGLTVVVVGGVVVSVVYPPSAPVILPALCALGTRWSCPASPSAPGQPGMTAPQPGDRSMP